MVPRELHRCQPIAVQESSLINADVQVIFHAFPFFRKISDFDGKDVITPQAYNKEFQKQLNEMRDFMELQHDHLLPPVKFNERFESITDFFERKPQKKQKDSDSIEDSQRSAPSTDERGVSVIIEHFPMDSCLDSEAGSATFRKGMQFVVQPAQAGLKFPEGAIFTFQELCVNCVLHSHSLL
jgi:hypothetical protein